MKILVTGGAGYIGSFIVRALKDAGFEPYVLDNLSRGHKEAIEGFPLAKIDLVSETDKLDEFFAKEKFDGVIHMAAYIQMEESCEKPLLYYENNVVASLNLVKAMVKNKVSKLVFSSTAGVYGEPEKLPIEEVDRKEPVNPYGETKLVVEHMLSWANKAYDLKSISIRYFNASGAALDGSIGSDPPDESHLIPNVLHAAIEGREFTIFGGDYDTPDGTCVRDYIHVLDLADNHTLALKALHNGAEGNIFNAGTGRGYSNKEVVEMVKKVTGRDLKVKIGPRRPGDAAKLVASIDKIKQGLGWTPKYGLKEIVKSAYLWHKTHPKGYKS